MEATETGNEELEKEIEKQRKKKLEEKKGPPLETKDFPKCYKTLKEIAEENDGLKSLGAKDYLQRNSGAPRKPESEKKEIPAKRNLLHEFNVFAHRFGMIPAWHSQWVAGIRYVILEFEGTEGHGFSSVSNSLESAFDGILEKIAQTKQQNIKFPDENKKEEDLKNGKTKNV